MKGFKLLLKLFLDYSILGASQYDKIRQEIQIIMGEDVKRRQAVFASFDEETRLHIFYFNFFMIDRYKVLSFS